MLVCELLLKNVLHVVKVQKLWLNSKTLYARYQSYYGVINLLSFANERTFMSRCFSSRKCHSFVQEIPSEKNSVSEQKILPQKVIENEPQEQVSVEKVKIYFETPKGEKIECLACTNQNVMNASIENDIAMHGNCSGEAICSVCHVYIDEKYQEFLPKISEEEAEMLDVVPNFQENSRLSCQIIIRKELEGAVFKLPPYEGPSYENPN